MKEQFDIQSFVDNIVSKIDKEEKEEKTLNEYVESYGAVKLNDGTIIKIKKNFYFLESLWKLFVLYKSLGDEKKLKQIINDTNGGLFDCGDVVLKLEDIKIIFRSQKYNNSSDEEKENMLFKNALINNHLDETIYYIDNFSNNGFDEDDYN